MSASFIRSSRAKSLLIDFFLTAVCLSHGDNPRVLAARRVGESHDAAGQHAQGDKPFLPIIETVIHECDARACEHFLGVPKIQAMLDEVAAVLGLVPFEHSVALFVVTSNRAVFPLDVLPIP